MISDYMEYFNRPMEPFEVTIGHGHIFRFSPTTDIKSIQEQAQRYAKRKPIDAQAEFWSNDKEQLAGAFVLASTVLGVRFLKKINVSEKTGEEVSRDYDEVGADDCGQLFWLKLLKKNPIIFNEILLKWSGAQYGTTAKIEEEIVKDLGED